MWPREGAQCPPDGGRGAKLSPGGCAPGAARCLLGLALGSPLGEGHVQPHTSVGQAPASECHSSPAEGDQNLGCTRM